MTVTNCLPEAEVSLHPPYQLAIILSAAIVIIGVAIFAIVQFSQPTEGAVLNQMDNNRWVRMEDLPSPVSQVASITYDSQIYLIGGYVNGLAVNYVCAYNNQTNTWSDLADKPTPVREANAVVIGEQICLPGGIASTNQPTSAVEVYSPTTNS